MSFLFSARSLRHPPFTLQYTQLQSIPPPPLMPKRLPLPPLMPAPQLLIQPYSSSIPLERPDPYSMHLCSAKRPSHTPCLESSLRFRFQFPSIGGAALLAAACSNDLTNRSTPFTFQVPGRHAVVVHFGFSSEVSVGRSQVVALGRESSATLFINFAASLGEGIDALVKLLFMNPSWLLSMARKSGRSSGCRTARRERRFVSKGR